MVCVCTRTSVEIPYKLKTGFCLVTSWHMRYLLEFMKTPFFIILNLIAHQETQFVKLSHSFIYRLIIQPAWQPAISPKINYLLSVCDIIINICIVLWHRIFTHEIIKGVLGKTAAIDNSRHSVFWKVLWILIRWFEEFTYCHREQSHFRTCSLSKNMINSAVTVTCCFGKTHRRSLTDMHCAESDSHSEFLPDYIEIRIKYASRNP